MQCTPDPGSMLPRQLGGSGMQPCVRRFRCLPELVRIEVGGHEPRVAHSKRQHPWPCFLPRVCHVLHRAAPTLPKVGLRFPPNLHWIVPPDWRLEPFLWRMRRIPG
eukprot:scaffold271_cov336-Pavlova_lutheri.AAC.17